jgi:hypothetical protein
MSAAEISSTPKYGSSILFLLGSRRLDGSRAEEWFLVGMLCTGPTETWGKLLKSSAVTVCAIDSNNVIKARNNQTGSEGNVHQNFTKNGISVSRI